MTVSWAGPLAMAAARTALMTAVQAALALVLWTRHVPDPLRVAGAWWPVYGTMVDLACLLALRHLCRREGVGFGALVGPVRLAWGRDVLQGLAYFLIAFPVFLGASLAAARWLYPAGLPTALLSQKAYLPLWARIWSLSLWWLVWSPTEEATYQAYALPRLKALTGRTWLAMAVVGVFWAAQHCALPFVADPRYLLFRFLSFLPGVYVLMWLYLRTRRLAPLVVAHWPMDISAAMFTVWIL